jgi:hypothetical protein
MDMKKFVVVFLNFANASKKEIMPKSEGSAGAPNCTSLPASLAVTETSDMCVGP